MVITDVRTGGEVELAGSKTHNPKTFKDAHFEAFY